MFTKNKIFLLIAIFAALSIAVAFYFYNKPPASARSGSAITVAAAELYRAYSSDAVAAQKKFSGKVLLVTGAVERIGKNQQGETVILLETNVPGAYVNCSMDEPASKIKLKQPVSIKGFCSGIGQGDEDLGIKADVYMIRGIVQD